MKTTLLTLTLALFSFVTYSQTNVPDDNFEAYLESIGLGDGMANNNTVDTSKISAITSLNISNKSISDLTGIEEFTSLQTFNCSFNSFSTLTLPNGNNLLELICQGPNITNIDAISTHTALTKIDIKYGMVSSLNVDANINLQYLDCYDNPIGSINLLNNAQLTNLNVYRCGLTDLDLSGNPLLTALNCIDNNLTTLNLSSNPALAFLDSSLCVNLTSITLPDTSSSLSPLYIYCTNCDSLSGMDVSNNPNLYWLDVRSSDFQNTLDLSNNNQLSYLNCSNNMLTGLTLPNPSDLFDMYINNNMISSLNLTGCTGLVFMDCQYNSLTSLDVSPCSILQELNCHHNSLMTSMTFDNSALKLLYCNDSPIATMNNTLSLTGLLEFGLWRCNLTTLDLTNSMVLQYVETVQNYNLNSFTLPSTTTLTEVYAWGSKLMNLNYANFPELQWLNIGINMLKSPDISLLPKLIGFWCNQNQLTSLNLKNSHNGILAYMWADDNPSLTCIQVDNVTYANNKVIADDWRINGLEYFSENCALVGLEDFQLSIIPMYPNPTNGKLTIELKTNTNYNLTNLYGQEVKKGMLFSGINQMDISYMSNGLYFLRLESLDGHTVKKVVKE